MTWHLLIDTDDNDYFIVRDDQQSCMAWSSYDAITTKKRINTMPCRDSDEGVFDPARLPYGIFYIHSFPKLPSPSDIPSPTKLRDEHPELFL